MVGVEAFTDCFTEGVLGWGGGEGFKDVGWDVLGYDVGYQSHGCTLRSIVLKVCLALIGLRGFFVAEDGPEPDGKDGTILGHVSRVRAVVGTCEISEVCVVMGTDFFPELGQHEWGGFGHGTVLGSVFDGCC